MPRRNDRYLHLLEPLAFGVFIAWYIWRLQAAQPSSWMVFPAWLTLSFALHRDTPKTLGWRADNFGRAARRAAVFFAAAIFAVGLVGFFFGSFHRVPAHLTEPRTLYSYFAFCVLQQVALNSFLTNRVLYTFEKPRVTALLAATIFAALHWPNPVLVPLTFVGGAAMAWLFARERNILPLAIGQAILGALVWWAFPVAWHHAMRVGPGYYNYHP
jgi:hypothetical protein